MKKLLYILLVLSLALSACGNEKGVSVENLTEAAAPLETALTALLDGDGDAYLNAFPPEMVKDYKEQDVYLYYYSLQDMTAWLKNNLRIYGASYGKDFFIRGSIVKTEKLDVSSLGDANLDYHTYMRYVMPDNTEEVQSVLFSYKIGGTEGSEEKEAKLYFVKQKGTWYLHPCFAFYTF